MLHDAQAQARAAGLSASEPGPPGKRSKMRFCSSSGIPTPLIRHLNERLIGHAVH